MSKTDAQPLWVDLPQFRAGMRRLAGAVTLITTSCRGEKQGLTASAVCSLTADPPLLLVCINKSASAHDPISESNFFAVNVLAADQMGMAQVFSDTAKTAERFKSGEWTTGITGAPLLKGALVTFDCEIEQRVAKGTHTIFIGLVKGVHLGENPASLIYFNGTFGTFGSLPPG